MKSTDYKFIGTKADPQEMSKDELVVDYALTKEISDAASARQKQIRGRLIEVVKGDSTYSADGCTINYSERKNETLDVEAAAKLADKKGIVIGTVYYEITPKKAVPQDVLDAMEQYFSLVKKHEITTKDVEKAVGHGHITQKEAEKLIIKGDPTPVLKATVDGSVVDAVIDLK